MELKMSDARIRALEARVDALESALRDTRNDIQWLSALVFAVPAGLMIAVRLAW